MLAALPSLLFSKMGGAIKIPKRVQKKKKKKKAGFSFDINFIPKEKQEAGGI